MVFTIRTSTEENEFKKKYGIDIHRFEQIDNFNDIDGLASLIDATDFVVSVSNTTVHIAGSIGKKTYLMLPNNRGKLWYWSKKMLKVFGTSPLKFLTKHFRVGKILYENYTKIRKGEIYVLRYC